MRDPDGEALHTAPRRHRQRHYVAVRELVPMNAIGRIADRVQEVLGWLGARDIEPDGAPFLKYATTGLLAWARERGPAWDTTDIDAGERWAARLELYRTNPAEVAEPDKWETDLMFRLAQ